MKFSNKYVQFVIGYIAFSFSVLQGLSFLISNYGISPKILDFVLFALVIGFLSFIIFRIIKSLPKISNLKNINKLNFKTNYSYLNIALTVLVGVFFIYYYSANKTKDKLIEIKLPEIISAYESNKLLFVYEEIISLRNNNITNPILDNYFQKVTTDVDIVSQPEGYDVYMDLLNDSVQNWTYLGKSPTYNVSVPNLRSVSYTHLRAHET